MDSFLSLSRQAFRSLHGLRPDREPVELPEEARERWQSWARRHRVQGLLHAGLPEAGAVLQAGAYGQARHTARFTHEAERLVTELSPGIPSLTLIKGPALAAQAWPDPGLRSFDDLDFMCRRRDYARLVSGMQAAGYTPDLTDARRMANRWHYGWGVAFHHPAGFMVEVNPRYFPPQYPWPCRLSGQKKEWNMEQLLEERTVQTPTPALHLLLCCMHAIWHGWARLEWLADIAGLLVRHREVLSQAQALAAPCPFTRRALTAGCGVATTIFGEDLMDALPSPAPEAVLQQAVNILTGTARQMSGGELRRFHEQFMTSREKTAYRIRRILIPGDGDFHWISLPAALRGFYWFLRPTRFLLYGKTGY